MNTGGMKLSESGLVVRVNTERSCGHVRTRIGDELLFRLPEGRVPEAVKGQVRLNRAASSSAGRLLLPQVGDLLLFERAPGDRGYRACPWVHAHTFSEALRSLSAPDQIQDELERLNRFFENLLGPGLWKEL